MALVWSDPELDIPPPETDEERAYLRLEKIERIAVLPRHRGGGATWFADDETE